MDEYLKKAMPRENANFFRDKNGTQNIHIARTMDKITTSDPDALRSTLLDIRKGMTPHAMLATLQEKTDLTPEDCIKLISRIKKMVHADELVNPLEVQHSEPEPERD